MKGIKRIHRSLIVVAVLALLVALLPLGAALGATLTSVSDVISPQTESVAAQHTIAFTIPAEGTEVPNSGHILITLTSFGVPDGDLSGYTTVNDGTAVTLTSVTGSAAADTVDIVIGASETIALATSVTVTITSAANITNPTASGNYTVSIATQDASAVELDTGSTTVAVGEGETYQFGIIAGTASLVTIVPGSESNVTLDGTKDTSAFTAVENTDDWNVVDARGTGAGWHLVVAAGSMTDSTANRPSSEVMTLDESDLLFTDNDEYAARITIVTSTTEDGDNGIIHNVDGDGSSQCIEIAGTDTYTHVTGTGLTVVTAAQSEGLGAFSLLPVIEVTVPAGASADNSTNFTLTVTLVED